VRQMMRWGVMGGKVEMTYKLFILFNTCNLLTNGMTVGLTDSSNSYLHQ